MSDANREIGVKITTSAELAGAKDAAKELSNVEKATQAADKVSKESGNVTEQLTKKKDGLKTALKGLAFEFPALSRLIGFAVNPWTALSAALGIGAAKLLQWKAASDQVIAQQARIRSFADTIGSIATRAKDFATEADEFEQALTRIATAGGNAAGKLKDLNDQIARQRGMQDQLANLGTQLAHAQIDQGVARGQIKPEDAAGMKAALDAGAAQQTRERELFAMRSQLSQAHFAARKTEDEIAASKAGRPSAETLGALEQTAVLTGKTAGDSQSGFEKFADDARTKIAHLEKTRETILKYGETAADRQDADYYAGEIAKLLDEIKRRKDDNAKVQAKAADAKRQFDAATAEARRLDAERQAATQRLKDIQEQIARLEAELKAKLELFKQSVPLEEAIRSTTTGTQIEKIITEKAEADARTAYEQYERFQRGEITAEELERTQYQLKYDTAPRRKPVTPYPRGGDVRSGRAEGVAASGPSESEVGRVAGAISGAEEEWRALFQSVATMLETLTGATEENKRQLALLERRIADAREA